MRLVRSIAILVALSASPSLAADAPAWTGWSHDLFARATTEQRFVILDLEAVWCHWCHVMEKTTYADPKVQELLAAKYLPVRVDQDANPDLSSRYGDWGWPATIVFAPDGSEIAKIRGYIEPERMQALLKAIIDDPSPGPSVGEAFEIKPATSAFLGKTQRAELTRTFDESYDDKLGGWGENQKYIDADSLDLAISRAEAGDATATRRARQTLDAAVALIDPVWGGVFQYSEGGSWSHPHFEKIISFQSQYLRQYSQAYAQWKEAKYLAAARDVERYLTDFLLSPDGAFYVSQDADLNHDVDGHAYYALDDAARRKLGLPRIDNNLYARENGWAISGLVAYYDASADSKALAIAERTAKWVLANRALPDGGFRHGDKDRGGPFLGDTVAMGQALLDLYAATGNRDWLTAAVRAGDFAATFRDEAGGFLTSKTSEGQAGVFARPAKLIDDQIQVARFMNMLNRYVGTDGTRELAAHAMRYLGAASAEMPRPMPGVLLADEEFATEPTHVTIVGHKDDARAQRLHAIARALPARYKRLEWLDLREGKLPNPDVDYPDLGEPAAFACSNRICSFPAFSAEELQANVAQMAKLKPARAAQN
ncbi:thioredoxin domain-containing protein [Bradyrhizobium sp. B120]|uniref:thioredoxin domain-containing protein n=1 Tax=Bradyrhizobium sp. B120 TaxID=3410088 RepID=UPI003B97F923